MDDKDKPKAAHAPHAKAHEPAKAETKRAKAAEVPRTKDGEVDLAKVKEARREAPDAKPGETMESAPERKRPAVIHPAPHETGVKHAPGEDPPEPPKDDEGEPAPLSAAPGGGPPVVEGETPFPDHAAQNLYGLRKEGRLFRCRQPGLKQLLIEADDEKQAKEAYCVEMRHLAGEDPESVKAPKAKAAPAAGAGTLVPPGMALVPATTPTPKVDPALVRCTKLPA